MRTEFHQNFFKVTLPIFSVSLLFSPFCSSLGRYRPQATALNTLGLVQHQRKIVLQISELC